MTYLERVREALKMIDEKSDGDTDARYRERDALGLEVYASIADELKRIADALNLRPGYPLSAPALTRLENTQ